MTNRTVLLERAAQCYVAVGHFAQAADCRERAGHLLAAAALWERAGDPARAADCWRRVGRPLRAAECLEALGKHAEAAECHREAGDALTGGWLLVTRAGQPAAGERMLRSATVGQEGEQVRLDLALALARALGEGGTDGLIRAVDALLDRLPGLPPEQQRRAEQWAVTAAERIDRPDLGATVFTSSYLARVPGVVERWQEWAVRVLGGTAGVPAEPLAH
ncbi:hypothetical protein ACFVHB_00310 [Kitasatospora sp. NPDC127111]|uniref:hypothetical protein n=1 Tax=Kitasatospora sp. NPDC127111 TaxID=3345363 RepID=UPI003631C4C2